MATPPSSFTRHVSALLQAWGRGDASALDAVSPATLERHRDTARARLRRELAPLPG